MTPSWPRSVASLAALVVLGACAHTAQPPPGVTAPSLEHLIETPASEGERLEPVGLTHLLRGLYFIHSGHAGAAIPHLRLALIYDGDSAFIHERLSGAWSVAGRRDEARRALEDGLAKQPEDPWLNWLAGELAVAEDRFAEAVPFLRRALVEEATISGAGPALVSALLWQSQTAEAEATTTTLLARKPGNVALALALAARLEDHGRLDPALAAYRRARVARPANRQAGFGEVRILALTGRDIEAADRLVPLFRFYPDEPQLFVQMTRLAVRAKRNDAQAYRAEALRLVEQDPFGMSLVAAGDLLEGRVEAGIELLRQAQQRAPSDVDVRLYLAEVLLQHARLNECIEVLTVEGAEEPRFLRPRAWCLAAAGRLPEAVTDLQRALRTTAAVRAVASDAARLLSRFAEEEQAAALLDEILDSAEPRVDDRVRWMATATLLDQYGHGDPALELLDRARFATTPNSEPADLVLPIADLQARYGQLDAALATLERHLDERPNDPVRLNALGFTLADANQQLDEAEVWLRRAVRLSPDDGFIIDSLAWLIYRRGDLLSAVRLLEWAVRAAPGDPEILRHLGDARRDLGQAEAARNAYRRALAAWPSPVLRRLLEARMQEVGSS